MFLSCKYKDLCATITSLTPFGAITMVRRGFGGFGEAQLRSGPNAIMGDRNPTDGQDGGQPRQATDAELSDRLKALDAAVRKAHSEQKAEDAAAAAPNKTSASAGMALAFRLGSEFVAGVLVGAGLGWGIDRFFGTTPWAMIVFLLLGFGAGILNMLRAAGESGRAKPPKGGT